MSLKISISVMIPLVLAFSAVAQDVSHHHVQQVQQDIQNDIKGTLDGVVKMPVFIQNNARQLVFPRSFNNSIAVNPWAQNKPRQRNMQIQGYNAVPQGNPWAPIGAPVLPYDSANMMRPEKNPYTDAGASFSRQMMPSAGFSTAPYGGYQNQFSPFNGGSFSTPFGDNFFPTNQFWPGMNNSNGSFPFMPW